jgi:hypothetical protein
MPKDVKSLAVAVAAVVAMTAAVTSARAATVKETFEKYDLLGTLASDCAKPADAKSPYLTNRIIDADHVELDKMVGPTARESATIVDKATESKPNELALSATIDDKRYDIRVQVEHGRIKTTEQTRADGQKVIAGGHVIAGGAETPWFGRCLQRVTIHNAPDGGGKCIEPLNGDIKPGVHLRTWDCNDTPPQILAFDTLNERVSVGDLCVDTEGGRSDKDVVLALAPCNGGPTQRFKAEPNGNNVKIVGVGGFCLDNWNGYRGGGAALDLTDCNATPAQAWQLAPALNLTWEENSGRSGHFVAHFGLPDADPRLCQIICIRDRQCNAWGYRKPQGRGDHQPHCWLFDKTESVNHDVLNVSGIVRPEAK